MASTKPIIKLAIVGCGAIVENNHLPALAQIPEISIAYFVDNDTERASALAERHGAKWARDIQDISPEINAALVAVPNHLHAEISIALLNRGLHVLCEKPMAVSKEQCKAICSAVSQSRRIFGVVHQMRFLPTILELKRLLEEDRLGKIDHVDISYGSKYAWLSKTNFYNDSRLAGGGVTMDTGCHLLDLAYYLFGDIHSAEMDALWDSSNRHRMDTAATIQVKFFSGLTGTLRVSRLATLENEVRVQGQNGFIRASLGDSQLTMNIEGTPLSPNNHAANISTQERDPFVELWMRFLKYIAHCKTGNDLCGSDEGMHLLKIIENLYKNRSWFSG